MTPWSVSHYRAGAEAAGVDKNVLEAAITDVQFLLATTPTAEPILSLRHLAAVAGVSYGLLRRVITRRLNSAYNEFVIVGRSGKRREISTPTRDLMTAQRFIAQHILADLKTGPNSFAYSKGSSIVTCAQVHCSSRWLVKFDVRDFFASIDERRVFRLFLNMGYRPLVAFELARLCTWPTRSSRANEIVRVQSPRAAGADYSHPHLGSLPMGAATSPMLSNLYMASFDHAVSLHCAAHSLNYSRYADDIFVSTSSTSFSRQHAQNLANFIRHELLALDLHENATKRVLAPPGARKVVLGLLVDGAKPRLLPEFKKRLRMHYHFLDRLGPLHHKARRSFPSVPILERHLRGLIAFAMQVEPAYGLRMAEMHDRIPWAFVTD